MTSQKWTEAEDATMLALLRSGMTRAQVANEIGRSRGAIDTRLTRILTAAPSPTAGEAVAGRPWQPHECNTLKKMCRAHVPVQRIAEALGRSVGGVRRRSAAMGLPRTSDQIGRSVAAEASAVSAPAVDYSADCRRHLADLIREHGDMRGYDIQAVLRHSRAQYAGRYELDVGAGYSVATYRVDYGNELSGCGSPAALCAVA